MGDHGQSPEPQSAISNKEWKYEGKTIQITRLFRKMENMSDHGQNGPQSAISNKEWK